MSTMMEQTAAVQGAARPRPGARRTRRGDAQVEGQRQFEFNDGRATRSSADADALDVLPAQPGAEHQFRLWPGGGGPRPSSSSSCGTPTPSSCNYARLDEFDPAAPQVPVEERPDMDRWILSDLQLLVRTAATNFESFNVMAFCLEAERFVDDKLSNWYVRRSRRRFWKSEQARRQAGGVSDAIHRADDVDKADRARDAVSGGGDVSEPRAWTGTRRAFICATSRRLTSRWRTRGFRKTWRRFAAGNARLRGANSVKIKVRQPLAELKVSGGEPERAGQSIGLPSNCATS